MEFYTYSTDQLSTGLDAENLEAAQAQLDTEIPVPEGTTSYQWLPQSTEFGKRTHCRMLETEDGFRWDRLRLTETLTLPERARILWEHFSIAVKETPKGFFAEHAESAFRTGTFAVKGVAIYIAESDLVNRLRAFRYITY